LTADVLREDARAMLRERFADLIQQVNNFHYMVEVRDR
jgi:hypothetical protein